MVISARTLGCNDNALSLTIDCMLIDCDDLDAMTAFWCRALDFEHVWTGPSGGHLLAAADGSGRRLGLMPSHDKKLGKNRVHFDLRPDDQLAEVRRLEALGAARVDIGQAGVTWVVMADPEGNEFCVSRSLADKTRAESAIS
jgi:catechol 2,3-dioxygenase-like lactoylglutathione lyase family enzyme